MLISVAFNRRQLGQVELMLVGQWTHDPHPDGPCEGAGASFAGQQFRAPHTICPLCV
jgi:hypothetical protein